MSGPVATWSTYRRLRPFVAPYSGRLSLVLLVTLGSTLLGLAQPYVTKLLIDDALIPGDFRMLLLLAGMLLAATLVSYALGYLAGQRYAVLSAAMLFDMRAALLRHLQTLSPRFYGRFRFGDLMSRLNRDVGDVQRVAADTLLAVVGNVLTLVGSAVMLALLDWRLFLVGTALMPASLWSFARLQRRLTERTGAMRDRGVEVGSHFADTMLGMRAITALDAGEHETARFAANHGGFVQAMLAVQRSAFLSGAVPGTILAAASTAVILAGGWMIVRGELTIGSLIAFMAYHARLLGPAQGLMGMASALATARVALARIVELLDTEPDVREPPDARRLGRVRQGIRIEHVALRHDRGPVLVDIDLFVRQGCFCAITGASGAGKSTLADLLVRHLDPDVGRVLVDGHDLRSLRLADIRREILLVDQAAYLFNDTIAANIAFAYPDADPDAIEAAGQAAGLESLIRRLPQGYATPVGERGQALSAGERHRVAIARALLRRPSVLVLDEPTAALDPVTEALVARGLRDVLPDATLIVITHKPALVAGADLLVTLDAGRAHVAEPLRLQA